MYKYGSTYYAIANDNTTTSNSSFNTLMGSINTTLSPEGICIINNTKSVQAGFSGIAVSVTGGHSQCKHRCSVRVDSWLVYVIPDVEWSWDGYSCQW